MIVFYFFQSHVPEQIKKVLNAEITGDNHIFTPLKKFPETFSEEERYICIP